LPVPEAKPLLFGKPKTSACKLYPFSILKKVKIELCLSLKERNSLFTRFEAVAEIFKEIEEAIELILGRRVELDLLTMKSWRPKTNKSLQSRIHD